MVFREGPMAGRIIAQRRKEMLAEAARYRLAREVVQRRRTWLWPMAGKALFWLGHFLMALGRWLERQALRYEGMAASQLV